MTTAQTRLPSSRADTDRGKTLMVAIPALNEEATIEDVIRRIPTDIEGVASIEVLVIDDGSTDDTVACASKAGAHVVSHPNNRGVGAAFHTALSQGIERGVDLIATIDADGQFDPADLPKLVAPVARGDVDFVTASRFRDPELVPRMPLSKLWGNRGMSFLISKLAGQKLHDVSCGFRCYDQEAALQLHLTGRFTYTQEAILNLAYKGLRIREVPLRIRGEREIGKSRVASNLFRYAWRSSEIIVRCVRDYRPLVVFGGAGLLLLLGALVVGGFLLGHYLTSGTLTPHKWAGFVSMTLLLLAVFAFHAAIVGDMLSRHRAYLEQLIYWERARILEAGRKPRAVAGRPAESTDPGGGLAADGG